MALEKNLNFRIDSETFDKIQELRKKKKEFNLSRDVRIFIRNYIEEQGEVV